MITARIKPFSLLPFILGLLLFMLIFLIFYAPKWEEVVEQNEDGSYRLTVDRAEKIQARQERIYHSELYALIAKVPGYYECPACPTSISINKRYFLNTGEIYKYGVTMNPAREVFRKENY